MKSSLLILPTKIHVQMSTSNAEAMGEEPHIPVQEFMVFIPKSGVYSFVSKRVGLHPKWRHILSLNPFLLATHASFQGSCLSMESILAGVSAMTSGWEP